MNKSDLVNKLASRAKHISLKDMEVIHDALQKKGSNATADKLVPIFDSEASLVHVDSQTPLGDGETEEPANRESEATVKN